MKDDRRQTEGAGARSAATTGAEALFASVMGTFLQDPAVTQGRMFGSPGLKVGGKVFAMLVKGMLVVKLPKGRVDALVGSGHGRHFDPGHGRLMKEWVSIASRGEREWRAFAEEARSFVHTGR